MPDRDELSDWLKLYFGLGRAAARKLLIRTGSAATAAAQLPELPPEQQSRLDHSLRWLDAEPARSLLCLGDADYPEGLLNSPDPPLLLFLQGRREQLERPALAVVGSRHPTPAGLELAEEFSGELARLGWVVVSGLAIGIDGAAHRGALAGAGATWAVLGGGIEPLYPPSHKALGAEIARAGLLISEHAPGTPSLPAQFPVRNRLIAALSQGCLVVEAAPRSGSLITARLAAEAGREVFALPGPVRSLQAQGCHLLIQQGAKLVQSVQDILDELPGPTPAGACQPLKPQTEPAPTVAPSAELDPVLRAMGHEVCSLDRLLGRLNWPLATLQAHLLGLELEGRVERLPGERFQARR
ncbi:DNA processing protein [Inhella inkyongensis]|uniref:DNA processing protein n=1 Tax=Inhella inkyongensis TaxID=392593 RepID=A0A840SD21_9BURK|nr:DNA-processing protein DprA [Inhella inkyongensis]MBB5206240.1 DNA processing protein [Inhella inkyongensis]